MTVPQKIMMIMNAVFCMNTSCPYFFHSRCCSHAVVVIAKTAVMISMLPFVARASVMTVSLPQWADHEWSCVRTSSSIIMTLYTEISVSPL